MSHKDNAPLVIAARLRKEGRDERFVKDYLAYNWGMDIHGKEVVEAVVVEEEEEDEEEEDEDGEE